MYGHEGHTRLGVCEVLVLVGEQRHLFEELADGRQLRLRRGIAFVEPAPLFELGSRVDHLDDVGKRLLPLCAEVVTSVL